MGTFEAEQIGLFIRHSQPLEPLPVTLPDDLLPLLDAPLPRPPRAVLFDVYGTLVMSGSGEVGTSIDPSSAPEGSPFLRAFEIACGSCLPPGGLPVVEQEYRQAIEESHRRSRELGVLHPEVDIAAVWRRVLLRLAESGLGPAPMDVEHLAIAYETAANPCWPMPGARTAIEALRRAGLYLGIVSNAQFYTRRLITALFGSSPEHLGFDEELVAWSYAAGRAKPDPALFDAPLAELQRRGIDSRETVYVGNDIRNDVATARGRGCMTVLFAGDRRSLRLHRGEPKLAQIRPDSVVSSLGRLAAVATSRAE